MIWLFIYVLLLLAIAILIVKYYDGEFTYNDEIIDRLSLTDDTGVLITTIYTVKRTYKSSRIKLIKQEIKI